MAKTLRTQGPRYNDNMAYRKGPEAGKDMKNSTPLEEVIQKPWGNFSGNLLAPAPTLSPGGSLLSSAHSACDPVPRMTGPGRSLASKMGWSPGPDGGKLKSGLYLLSQDSPQNLRTVGWAFGLLASLMKDRKMAKDYLEIPS